MFTSLKFVLESTTKEFSNQWVGTYYGQQVRSRVFSKLTAHFVSLYTHHFILFSKFKMPIRYFHLLMVHNTQIFMYTMDTANQNKS